MSRNFSSGVARDSSRLRPCVCLDRRNRDEKNKTFQIVREITVVNAFHSLTGHTLEQEPFLPCW